MTRSDLDPDLDRLGDALRAGATRELARGPPTPRPNPGPMSGLRRPRVLAGGTLGVAGIGTALALALTAGGATAPPAFAINSNQNGSLTVDVADPGQGLFPLNTELANKGYGEHIEFTMAQGPAASPGIISCVESPAGASVSGPAINVTVGPGDTNTETIATGNTGAGVWHVASCQRYNGADPMHPVLIGGPGGASPSTVRVPGTRRPQSVKVRRGAQIRRPASRRHSTSGPVAFNLDTDGGLPGVNQRLAAMGIDEHVDFTMAQGAASRSGVVSCTPADPGVTGPPVTVTVGSGDSNTETIAAGNTGAGTWHVASCTRSTGTDTRGPTIVR